MALKSAKSAGLDVGQGMEGGLNMVRMGWNAVNAGKNLSGPYNDQAGFPYTFKPSSAQGAFGENGVDHNKPNRTALGLCMGVFLGLGKGDLMMETMANDVMHRAFTTREKYYQIQQWPPNTYYLYYNTLGLFQVGGDRWKQWNDICRDFLVHNQIKSDDCFDGSWSVTGGFMVLTPVGCCIPPTAP